MKKKKFFIITTLILCVAMMMMMCSAAIAAEPVRSVAPTTVAPTTVAPTTVAPTTVAPTTVEPTTVEPTTVEPTTVEPTTAEPTTKKESTTDCTDCLYSIDNVDNNYIGYKFTLSDKDRDDLEHIVMGEMGDQGFFGCALLAQTIRDNWLRGGYTSANDVRIGCHYDGYSAYPPNSDSVNAVKYIFDEGKNAIKHRTLFMYNPIYCKSDWHESQHYLLTVGSVKFFDAW